MGAYEYAALDASGKELKGVLEGDTARQVRQQLRDKGWTPLSVDTVAEDASGGQGLGKVRLGGSIKAAELALITRQLATLVGSGLPLEEALRAAAAQAERPRLRSMITAVRARVMEGHTLADGLAQFPRAFPELYRATVGAGEHTGNLDLVLERLAEYTESRQQMQQKIQNALVYPVVLTVIAIAVVVLLLTYVVPQVTEVFADIGQGLPPLTVGLIAVSDFLRDHGIWLLLLIALGVIAFGYGMRRETFRYRVHALALRLPLISRVTRGVNAARFARTFSILAGSGVPVLEAMRIAAQVMSNLPMRAAVTDAATRVREGSGISKALEQSGQFPPMLMHLIASGENSGRLESMLERGALNQEREVQSLIDTSLAIFEPAMIVAMGTIVLVIVAAILLPIFELNQLVG
ncbi:type II secretion system inner membrane protein GspF [Aquisalimonas sp. 2447]|uniref:type II secretion system inner membrane protein GspF n=1 Tax=Aquisalimonas sp. 2447 TaxID=2740807 RepID=UPI0014324E1D|nr:type II secretion system inner membrane protein GspF [Aquisalimonas sp. 2447]QIT56751.1 type II secretion system inner membrane protein GspF [Aquisalimonas sp. 2447]